MLTMTDRIKQFDELMKDTPVSHEFREYLIRNGFFTAPASTKYHGGYEGGLFDHCYLVAKTLLELSVKNDLKWSKPESPLMVGMFHDLCKIDNYVRIEDHYEYNNETLLRGHGTKSVMLLSQFYNMSEEEIAAITYHMGAFTEKEEWRDYTRGVNNYTNVLWTHHADMIASHVMGV